MVDIIIDTGSAPDSQFSDAARHASDAVQIHLHALGFEAIGKWVAIRLSDGKSDGILYDTKKAAVEHQLHENMCAYVCVPPGGMPPADAESYLRTNRELYERGWRLADPDKHVIDSQN